jgi:hypothetical protein
MAGKQQLWRGVFYMVCSFLYSPFQGCIMTSKLVAVDSCEMIASRKGHEHGSIRIFIVRSHYLAVPSEDIEGFMYCVVTVRLPLWSSGHSSWLQIQRSQVRFLVLPDFLRSSGPGTGSTQPREDNWGATWKENRASRKPKLTVMGIRCAGHATPSIC